MHVVIFTQKPTM